MSYIQWPLIGMKKYSLFLALYMKSMHILYSQTAPYLILYLFAALCAGLKFFAGMDDDGSK